MPLLYICGKQNISTMNTIIGIKTEDTVKINKELNQLLANYQIHYQNLRGLHWNITGKNFFELHVKFEEYYTDAQVKIDEIAERILTLQGQPLHTFQDYLDNTNIPVGKNITTDEEAVKLVITGVEELLRIERSLLDLTDELNDEGTNSLVSDFISEQEKTLWMLYAWLK